MFEKLNKYVAKIELVKDKIEDRNDKNQGCLKKNFLKFNKGIIKLWLTKKNSTRM